MWGRGATGLFGIDRPFPYASGVDRKVLAAVKTGGIADRNDAFEQAAKHMDFA